eukprot:359849-Chlamydomonas_euryale.AAC.4
MAGPGAAVHGHTVWSHCMATLYGHTLQEQDSVVFIATGPSHRAGCQLHLCSINISVVLLWDGAVSSGREAERSREQSRAWGVSSRRRCQCGGTLQGRRVARYTSLHNIWMEIHQAILPCHATWRESNLPGNGAMQRAMHTGIGQVHK